VSVTIPGAEQPRVRPVSHRILSLIPSTQRSLNMYIAHTMPCESRSFLRSVWCLSAVRCEDKRQAPRVLEARKREVTSCCLHPLPVNSCCSGGRCVVDLHIRMGLPGFLQQQLGALEKLDEAVKLCTRPARRCGPTLVMLSETDAREHGAVDRWVGRLGCKRLKL
jgi:hypothetical protein